MKNVHEIEIKLEKEWVECLDKAFKKKNKEVKIDGFRKGTVPKDIFIQNFGIETLYAAAINPAVEIAYDKMLEDTKLEPVTQTITDIVGISDSSLIVKFTVITKPEVKLGKYKKLGIKKPKITVSAEEINEELEHMREHMADLIVKEGKIAKGDTAVIDFVGYVNGKKLDDASGENYPLEIGSHCFIPGFEEGLIGLEANDKKTLNLTFPKNYVEDLKNKPVKFEVTVNEVKTRKLPEMNEEFFIDLGYDDIKTEAELKDKIKEELTKSKEQIASDEFLENCLDKASENLEVEINPEIIEDETNRMLEHFTEQLKAQQLSIDIYYQMTGTDRKKLLKNMEPEAEKRVKYRYLIEAIADAEKIAFTDKEAQEKAKEMADNYGVSVEEFTEEVMCIEMIKYDMKMRKAMEILMENN